MISYTISTVIYNGQYGLPTLKNMKIIIIREQKNTAKESMHLEALTGCQSLSNEQINKLVWRDVNGNSSQKRIMQQIKVVLCIKDVKIMDVLELTDYLKNKKIVKGYILK